MFKDFLMFSIKDTVTGVLSDIKLFVNEAQALRWFDGFCSESKISADLQLFKLGSFDCLSGQIIPCCDFVKNGGSN